MTPRLVGAERLPAALALNQVLFNITDDRRSGDRRDRHRATRTPVGLRDRPRDLRRDDRGGHAHASDAAAPRGRRAAAWRRSARGSPTSRPPVLQSTFRRHHRDGLRHAAGAVRRAGGDAVPSRPGDRRPALLRDRRRRLRRRAHGGWVGGRPPTGARGRAGGCLWGAGIAAFGLAGAHLVALVCLAVAEAPTSSPRCSATRSCSSRSPEALRGRLSGVHIFVVTGGPRLGDFEAGLVAQIFTPTVSVISGGLLCIAGAAAVAWRAPKFRRYHAGDAG